jgi:hypothetical protein
MIDINAQKYWLATHESGPSWIALFAGDHFNATTMQVDQNFTTLELLTAKMMGDNILEQATRRTQYVQVIESMLPD